MYMYILCIYIYVYFFFFLTTSLRYFDIVKVTLKWCLRWHVSHVSTSVICLQRLGPFCSGPRKRPRWTTWFFWCLMDSLSHAISTPSTPIIHIHLYSAIPNSSFQREIQTQLKVLESISPWQCYRRCFPKLDLQNCHPPHTQPGNPPTSLWGWSHAQHKYLQPGARRTEKSRCLKTLERNMADSGILLWTISSSSIIRYTYIHRYIHVIIHVYIYIHIRFYRFISKYIYSGSLSVWLGLK